jgi:hypothetical protein
VLLTSGGQVTFDSNTYTSEDSSFGFLSFISAFEDGDVNVASSPEFTFEIPSDAGIVDVTASDVPGSEWVLYWGAVDPSTGAVVGTPEELARGFLNKAFLAVSESRRQVKFTTYTREQFQLIRRGVRLVEDPVLNPLMPTLPRKIYWRASEPVGQTTRGSTGGSSGGTVGDINARFT